MKKLVSTVLIIFTCGTATALPVGNPADPSLLCDGLFFAGHCGDFCDPCLRWYDALSIRAGFYGDYVFNRHLEIDQGSGPDIEDTELFTNAGLIVANFWDKVDVFATLGATNFFIETNANAFAGDPGSRFEIETSTSFSWSLGGRITVWECGCTILGIEGQYFRAAPYVTHVTQGAITSAYFSREIEALYSEWQIGIGVSQRINIFVPYLAVKYSRPKLRFSGNTAIVTPTSVLFDLNGKKHWGYAVGITLIDCDKASVTAEGRFGDEKAFHVNGQIRF